MFKEDFIKRASVIHNNKYVYTKVIDGRQIDKVTIICPEHGEFQQTMFAHLHGQGCPKCAYEEKGRKRQKTTLEFIEEARIVHGDKYIYEGTEYLNNYTKVKIRCPKHGDFFQMPYNHLHGQGCPICAGKKKR